MHAEFYLHIVLPVMFLGNNKRVNNRFLDVAESVKKW